MMGDIKGIPIPIELGAFVSCVIVFLVFIRFWVSEQNKTQRQRDSEYIAKFKEIADDFQDTVKELTKEQRASQRNYQEQLQVLTDSHIKVSRESIAMLAEIKSGYRAIEDAFHSQARKLETHSSKLETFEREMGKLETFEREMIEIKRVYQQLTGPPKTPKPEALDKPPFGSS